MAHSHEEEPLPPDAPRVTLAVREPRLRRPPFWMIALFLVVVIASWVPLVMFARARVRPSDKPRVQLAQDMGSQPKYRELQTSPLFADGRADRPRVAGTVQRGGLQEDDHYFRGYKLGGDNAPAQFIAGFPGQVKLTEEFVRRGQERFNIYCSVCHGLDGSGNGPVHRRAEELQGNGAAGMSWVKPANLHDANVRARPEGHLYNTINVGIRNMPGYGWQIPVEDRWAIVAYVRALQMIEPNQPAGAAAQASAGGSK
jgi:mono/diheme cytochrome c family protein